MVEWRGAAVGLGLRIRFTYNSALLPNLCSLANIHCTHTTSHIDVLHLKKRNKER